MGTPVAELLTPSAVRALLEAHGLAPRKASGQNFIHDANTIRKIVRDAGIGPDDTVLEIGPGLGSLTIALAETARRVVALEVDSGLIRALGESLDGLDNVTVVEGDALRADLGALVDGQPARLISNLPYNIATPIVMRGLDDPAITDLFVMVQREVGERWAAAPGHDLYGGVSAKLALRAHVRVAARVPRGVFHPVPNVDSVTVAITRRADAPADYAWIARVIDAAFAQRRKTLRNTLRQIAAPDAVAQACTAADVDPSQRAEELDAPTFARLARALDSGTS